MDLGDPYPGSIGDIVDVVAYPGNARCAVRFFACGILFDHVAEGLDSCAVPCCRAVFVELQYKIGFVCAELFKIAQYE